MLFLLNVGVWLKGRFLGGIRRNFISFVIDIIYSVLFAK